MLVAIERRTRGMAGKHHDGVGMGDEHMQAGITGHAGHELDDAMRHLGDGLTVREARGRRLRMEPVPQWLLRELGQETAGPAAVVALEQGLGGGEAAFG